MRLDELPKSARIEDRRGVTVARGGIGIGTIVVLGLIGWALGIDPRLLIGGAEMMSRSGGPQQQADAGSTTSSGSPSDAMGHFVAAVLGSTETVWTDIFAQAGRTYKPPTLVMFSGATQSGCGFAKSAMGPFYCPLDQKVYLDTSFFQDLEGRLGACHAWLASGLTEATQSGTSLNRETWTLHCRRHPPSGMIDCSDSRKVTLCPMPSPTARRHNVRGGSRPA
jgi:predicted metalloprotease